MAQLTEPEMDPKVIKNKQCNEIDKVRTNNILLSFYTKFIYTMT